MPEQGGLCPGVSGLPRLSPAFRSVLGMNGHEREGDGTAGNSGSELDVVWAVMLQHPAQPRLCRCPMAEGVQCPLRGDSLPAGKAQAAAAPCQSFVC